VPEYPSARINSLRRELKKCLGLADIRICNGGEISLAEKFGIEALSSINEEV